MIIIFSSSRGNSGGGTQRMCTGIIKDKQHPVMKKPINTPSLSLFLDRWLRCGQ